VIEADLDRPVERADASFTDDRPDNVDAVREFAWDAQLFQPDSCHSARGSRFER
jgi:putative hydrolase of the HAD superfamily